MRRVLSSFALAAVAFAAAAGSAGAGAAPGAPASSPEAAALLAKHRAYVGWEYGDGTVPSLELTGTLAFVDRTGTRTDRYRIRERRIGLLRRTTQTKISTGIVSEDGFTGSLFWYSNENGFTAPDRGDGVANAVSTGVVFGEAFSTLAATVRRSDTIAGSPVVVLREGVPHGDDLDLYLDPQSGALRRAVVDPDGDPETIEIDAYGAPQGGKRVITGYHYARSPYRHVFDTVAFGAAVKPADLHPPAPTARWTFGSGAAVPLEFGPMQLRDGHTAGASELRVYVSADVNGVRGHFIVDTGAGSIAFTDDFARRAKLERIDTLRFGGIGAVGGNGSGRLERASTIAFADGSVLHDVVVTSGVAVDEERYDGLLGYDFLAGAILDFDLDAKSLRISDATATEPVTKDGFTVLPDLSSGVPVVPVTFDGRSRGHAMFDSGNPFYMLVSDGYLSKLTALIVDTNVGSTLRFRGASGASEIDRCGTLGTVTLGPISYTHAPVCFSPSLGTREGIVGLDFLKNFNFAFDYPDGKIVLYPRHHP